MTIILVVEDERAIAELLSFTLKEAGWSVVITPNFSAAWQAIQDQMPHLILLDWMLPDQTGLQLLSKIRSNRQTAALPVIMLTAKGMEEDKVQGLDYGADDYMTKPFSPKELVSRIKALLRRKSPEHAQNVLSLGALTLDPVRCVVTVEECQIEIGHAEFKLLKFLMAYPERVFSRSHLLDKVWGDHVVVEERTVDVHILRLRKALGKMGTMVKTVRSVGYMLSTK